jgi:aminoglycoside phosphotransferase (APT) family kinase protein
MAEDVQELDDFDAPWRRDPDEVQPQLEAWARHAVHASAAVSDLATPDNGMSSETMLFTVEHPDGAERCAARLAPLPSYIPVFPEYDLDLQRRCMEIVGARTTVPVPEILWFEQDATWLGTPFLVMRRVEGTAPTDIPPYVFGGWLAEANADDRGRLQRAFVEAIAGIHTITPATDDLAFLARADHGDSPLDQQLGYQRAYYEWAREDETYPLAWLDEHRPTEGPPVLNWGDARIGNVLFADFEPVAVLDWEMAAVGPPEVDIAWAVFLHRFFQDLAETFGLPGLPDFMRSDDVAATYEAATGRALHNLDWYEVFAALRFAIVSVRTSTRAIAYGYMEPKDDVDDLVMFRALLERMIG